MKKTPPVQGAPRFRSNLEADYAGHLDLLQKAGRIVLWRYEDIRFRIGGSGNGKPGWYMPDFLVICDNEIQFHECKGFKREAGMVRLRAAAKLYSMFRWYLIQAAGPGKKRGFSREEI